MVRPTQKGALPFFVKLLFEAKKSVIRGACRRLNEILIFPFRLPDMLLRKEEGFLENISGILYVCRKDGNAYIGHYKT